MDIADGENILRSKQLTKNGSQATEREQQVQIEQMKEMCFLLSAYQKR